MAGQNGGRIEDICVLACHCQWRQSKIGRRGRGSDDIIMLVPWFKVHFAGSDEPKLHFKRKGVLRADLRLASQWSALSYSS
eukprot:scaffold3951_cov69-Cyclotella_meneghiniana.AAC.10